MKLFSLLILFSLLLGTPDNDMKDSKRIRILTYNVKNCTGMDGKTGYGRVAEVIKRINADVVALQELDSVTVRARGVAVADTLAALTGMYRVYGASIAYQGGKYGIGVLSKQKPLKWRRIPLPGREEQRSLLIVEFDDFIMCCTHLSLTKEDRLASVRIINDTLANETKPVILAGDFNAVPSSEPILELSGKWKFLSDTSVFTSPSVNPKRCIDYVLGLKSQNSDIKTRRSVTVQEHVASDHLPVWVDIEISNR